MNKAISKNLKKTLATSLAVLVLGTSLPVTTTVYADAEHNQFARASEMSKQKKIEKYGMTPISGEYVKDGTYDVNVTSTSSFFRVHSAELIVQNGDMQARLTMETYSYPLLYLGTAEEAAEAPGSDYIDYEEVDDWYVFTIPVKGLNTPIDCASFSKKKKKWYNRKILFDASSLPSEALEFTLPDYDLIEQKIASSGSGEGTGADTEEGGSIDYDDPIYAEAAEVDLEDGRYSVNVALTGGSGRASISTPTLMTVEDGKAYVELLWSSPNYDWMRIGGVTYQNEAEEGANSVFHVPIPEFDSVVPIVADTTAMGDPVAINYSLTFYQESIGDEGLIPQIAAKKVVVFAIGIIVAGFFLNLIVKKRRKA